MITSLVMMSLTITKIQAQCEEIFYTVGTSSGTELILIGSAPVSTISWNWAVCNTSLCYGDTGQTVLFEQFVKSDTVKRSEEHTSELQSRRNLVCLLLLEKKKLYLYLIFHTP